MKRLGGKRFTADSDDSRALVSEESRERGRGQGRGQGRSHQGVLREDDGGYSREVALLGAFIATMRGISSGIALSIKHMISLQRQQQQ